MSCFKQMKHISKVTDVNSLITVKYQLTKTNQRPTGNLTHQPQTYSQESQVKNSRAQNQ